MFPIAANRSDEESGKLYVDDVFSTYLYTGNGGTQTINNGMNLLKTDAWKMWSAGQYYTTGGDGCFDIDSSGNVYFGGLVGSPKSNGVIKLNSSGNSVWEVQTRNDTSTYGVETILSDSLGNVYFTGNGYDSNNFNYYQLTKCDSSGAIQWAKKLVYQSVYSPFLQKDSSDNIYVSVNAGVFGCISKFNSSGAQQWSIAIKNLVAGACQVKGMYIDSADNLFVSSDAYDVNNGVNLALLLKFNTSGTLVWQTTTYRSGSIGASNRTSIGKDSSGNIYVASYGGLDAGGGYDFPIIQKYNSSGTFLTSFRINYPSATESISNVRLVIDGSNNIILSACGTGSAGATYLLCITTDGWPVWQKKISGSSGTVTVNDLKLDSTGKVLVGGNMQFNSNSAWSKFVLQITTSGILAGSLNNFGNGTMTISDSTDGVRTTCNLSNWSYGSVVVGSPLSSSAITPTVVANSGWGASLSSQSQQLNDGLVWIKPRSVADTHTLYDTVRGVTRNLSTAQTGGQGTLTNGLTVFNANGFTGNGDLGGAVGQLNVSWTFRKAAKFFDVVTYTGDGVALRRISHSLGVTPGMIIIKQTNAASNWWTAARKDSLNWAVGSETNFGLNLTNAATNSNYIYPSPYSPAGPTDFCPDGVAPMVNFGSQAQISNTTGATYVAYLFAHDTSANGIIQCGSYTTDGSGNATVNLGWEPQFVLAKLSTAEGNWRILDSMRGLNMTQVVNLNPNLSNAEFVNNANYFNPTATGFQDKNLHGPSQTVIYMAIRRPNKPPTTGTQVYNAIARTGDGLSTSAKTGVGFTPDMVKISGRYDSGGNPDNRFFDRLRGTLNTSLASSSSNAEQNPSTQLRVWGMDGVTLSSDYGGVNDLTLPYVDHYFRRAPGFMDVVCYTGTGSANTQTHNLGVSPELIIWKARNFADNWFMAYDFTDTTNTRMFLDLTHNGVVQTYASFSVFVSKPTSTSLPLGSYYTTNGSGSNFVAYLFATLAGISKVGSYTGNGSSLNIDCGFAAGARFVLIKRTDSAGEWYVWDTARGIVTGNDPHLSLNTVAAEVTTDDSIDPYSAGFTVNQLAATNINVTSATYIFLAIS